jgi:hypothetical protein
MISSIALCFHRVKILHLSNSLKALSGAATRGIDDLSGDPLGVIPEEFAPKFMTGPLCAQIQASFRQADFSGVGFND